MNNVRGMALSRKKIAEITKTVRKSMGLENILYFPVVECYEVMAADENIDFNYEIVEEAELRDTYATTNTVENTVYIREDVYRGAVKGNPRDRFTLCHEMGHLFLHRPMFISYARGIVPLYRQPEWQADVFAGELMAPRELVNNLSIKEIANKCGMSNKAATVQYNKIHIA